MPRSAKPRPPSSPPDPEEWDKPRNPYMGIGDRCRLSERTIRNAFARKPITWHTARVIANALHIDMGHFRIIEDNRGRNKKAVQKLLRGKNEQ